MEKIATPPPLLAGYADAAAQESVRNVCLIHAGRKFREKLNDLFKNLRPKCLNSIPLLCEEGNTRTLSNRTSLIIDPEDVRLPALTPLGQKIRAEIEAEEASRTIGNETIYNSWADHSLYTRCFARPIPRIGEAYNHGVQILQMPGYVAIHYESMHDVRIIPLDGRLHADPNINVPQPRSTIPLPSES